MKTAQKVPNLKITKAFEIVVDLYELGGDNLLTGFSAYINTKKSKAMPKLFRHIRRHLDSQDERWFDYPIVFKAVFPKKEYNKKTLSNLVHQLRNQGKEFIMQDKLLKNEFLKRKMMAEHLKGLNKVEAYVKAAEGILKDYKPEYIAQWHHVKGEFYDEIYFQLRKSKDKKYVYDLEVSILHYSIHHAIKNCIYACEKWLKKVWIGEEMSKKFESQMEAFFYSLLPKVKENLEVRLLMMIFAFLKQPTLEQYEAIQSDFFANFKEFSGEAKFIFRYLVNGTSIINPSNGRLNQKHYLYQFGIKHRLFIVNGIIQDQYFTNIVINFCRVDKYEEANLFLTNHKKFTTSDNYNMTKTIYTAEFLFHQGDYVNPPIILNKEKHDDITYVLRKLVIDLKCAYQSDKEGSLEQIENIEKKFLTTIKNRKKEIGSEPLFRLKRLITFLKKMALPSYARDCTKNEFIAEYNLLDERIAEGKWLKQKINELRG